MCPTFDCQWSFNQHRLEWLTQEEMAISRSLYSTNSLVDRQQDADTPSSAYWGGSVGVRLGSWENGFLLADDYSSNGVHEGTLAYELNGGWGTFTTGLNHSNAKGSHTVAISAGYIQRSKNFDWGRGLLIRSRKPTPRAR